MTGKHFKPTLRRLDGAQPVPTPRRDRSGSTPRGAASQPARHAAPGHRATAHPTSRRTAPRGPKRSRRSAALAALALVLVLAGVGGVVAWLVSSSQVENQFEVGTVEPVINEDGPNSGTPFKEGDTIKQNVTVTNTGNVPIYVRAQVNVYWQDANGNQLWQEPAEGKNADSDYTREGGLPADNGWEQGSDGFYYWTAPLPVGGKTNQLINKIYQSDEQLNRHTDDRKLVVDISVQGIQADPRDAVIEAWNVNVADGGTLELRTAGEGA